MNHTGEIAALAAALCWAVATVMYRPIGLSLSPLVMNLYKGVLSSVLLCLTVAVGWVLSGRSIVGMEPGVIGLLAVSGALGIGLGDTAFFGALYELGSRRALLLGTLSPPMAVVIGFVFLGESMGFWACVGIGLTVAGVAWVITERSEQNGRSAQTPTGCVRWGVAFGMFFALMQATGLVISRKAMMDTQAGAELTALVRLCAGSVTVLLILPFVWWRGGQGASPKPRKKPLTWRGWGFFSIAVVIGTYGGIWLLQVSLDYTSAGITQTLQSTSPLFVLPIAALLGERVSLRATMGAAVAVGGIVLLFSST